MEAMKGDWCDLCLCEIENTEGSYRDHIFVICARCVKLEDDMNKLMEKVNNA